MALYTCGKCRFTFERKGGVEVCPDCGNANVRDATEQELLDFQKIRAEIDDIAEDSST